MPKKEISSLHSPYVERVKALLNSRSKKIRKETGEFIVDSAQVIMSALSNSEIINSSAKILFATKSGLDRLEKSNINIPETLEFYEVTDAVMAEMSEVETSQGLLMICEILQPDLDIFLSTAKKIAFFWQLQDPGNAGTVIRSADACGFDGVILSNESVDIYSPKVIRSTVGSIWNIPIINNVDVDVLIPKAADLGFTCYALDAKANSEISELSLPEKCLLIFGNEARGLPNLASEVKRVRIPMKGNIESFNVASAATIAMYEVGLRKR